MNTAYLNLAINTFKYNCVLISLPHKKCWFIMSGLDELISFWGEESPIAKKASRTYSVPKYELPPVPTENGANAFEQIGLYIIKINPKKMEEQGFIDLDEEWKNSKDETIVEFREQLYDENTSLIDLFPTPFCGRKAYFTRILLENKQNNTDNGIVNVKVIRNLKQNKFNDKNMDLSARVCVFHNKDLGYNPNASHNTVMGTDEKNNLVEKKDENRYQYRWINVTFPKELGTAKLFDYINKKIEEDPTRMDVLCFALTPYIKTKLKDDVDKKEATADDYWYNMTVDDVFLI